MATVEPSDEKMPIKEFLQRQFGCDERRCQRLNGNLSVPVAALRFSFELNVALQIAILSTVANLLWPRRRRPRRETSKAQSTDLQRTIQQSSINRQDSIQTPPKLDRT